MALRYSKSKPFFFYETSIKDIKKILIKKALQFIAILAISCLVFSFIVGDFIGSLMVYLMLLSLLTVVLSVFSVFHKFPLSVRIKNDFFYYTSIKLNGRIFEKKLPLENISSELEYFRTKSVGGYNLRIRYTEGYIDISDNSPGWNYPILLKLHEVIQLKKDDTK